MASLEERYGEVPPGWEKELYWQTNFPSPKCQERQERTRTVRRLLLENNLPDAGRTVELEQRLKAELKWGDSRLEEHIALGTVALKLDDEDKATSKGEGCTRKANFAGACADACTWHTWTIFK